MKINKTDTSVTDSCSGFLSSAGSRIFGMLLSMALFTGCSQGKNDGRRYNNDSYHGE